MTDLYETYQALYARTVPLKAADVVALAPEPGEIAALRALKDALRRVAGAIEAAVFDLQNAGKTNARLSEALSLANHCAAGAAQLLVAALDNRQEIRAAIADMDGCTDQLDAIRKRTAALIEDIDHVTGVLDTAGRTLKLVTT